MNTKNSLKVISLILLATVITSSCTEKINLKLKDSSPQLTIEGNISDMPGPYYVILTTSRLYTQDNSFTGVPSAQVVISDDAGNIDTLTETIAGLYQTNSIQGIVGRTYKLQVTTGGTTYMSLCTMQAPVDIDSVVFSTETNFKGETKNKADILVQDPAGVQNQYRVVSHLNGVVSDGFKIHSDRLWDGKLRSFNVPQDSFNTGDTLQIDLWSIDSHIYDYFNEFNLNDNNFGAPAAPANPTSVYTPEALGYFSAHSIKSKTIIIQ